MILRDRIDKTYLIVLMIDRKEKFMQMLIIIVYQGRKQSLMMLAKFNKFN